jgi:hypothetical protein
MAGRIVRNINDNNTKGFHKEWAIFIAQKYLCKNMYKLL